MRWIHAHKSDLEGGGNARVGVLAYCAWLVEGKVWQFRLMCCVSGSGSGWERRQWRI
jgi:hypothetical protein